MPIKVYIDGGEGTTGLMLKQRLLSHPEVELLISDSTKRKILDYKLTQLLRLQKIIFKLQNQMMI